MKAFLSIFIIVLGLKTFSQTNCSPFLKEVYSFKVGDIFQYKEVIMSEWDFTYYESHQRNTLVEKSIVNDSLFLVFDVMYCKYDLSNYRLIEKMSYQDIIVIIDSTSHFLNACDSQLVYLEVVFFKLGEKLHDAIPFGEYYARISILEQNGEKVKIIGGQDGLFNDSLTLAQNIYIFEQKYSEGKGMIRQYIHLFEWISDLELEGYIINGVKTGTIWTDLEFPTSINKISENINIEVYPTIVQEHSILKLSFESDFNDLKVVSIDGRIQQFEIINKNAIKLIDIRSGIYFVVVCFDDNIIIKKFIKQ